MRKLLRRIARYRMKLDGVQHMNKPHGGSYFSRRWRDYFSRRWRDYI